MSITLPPKQNNRQLRSKTQHIQIKKKNINGKKKDS